MSRRRRLAWAGLALVATIGLALGVSRRVVRPPVLFGPEMALFGGDVRKALPDDAERVELALDADTTLRGWYLPADDGAGLVLHLLESSASVDSPFSSRALVGSQLADLGFASLFLDYSGIGASSGTRSAANLARDARAMWDEALRRVDGDPARVVLRCTSIGTLAALPLLQAGARPAGVILLLPVLPDTLAERFAASFYGRPASWLARATFRRVVDEDMFAVVRGTPTAWLAVQAEFDQMTSAEERAAIESAILAVGGRVERLQDDHLVSALVLRGLCAAELSYLTEIVPGVRDVEARWARFVDAIPAEMRASVLADTARIAALRRHAEWSYAGDERTLLALPSTLDDVALAVRLRWWLREPRYRKLDVADLRGIADLEDPAGRIPFETLLTASRIESLGTRTFAFRAVLSPADIERVSREALAGDGRSICRSSSTFGGVEVGVELQPGSILGQLRASGLSDVDARRQLARALLKAYGYPDRCVLDESGATRIEYFADGTWRPMETDPSLPALAVEDSAMPRFQAQMDAAVQD